MFTKIKTKLKTEAGNPYSLGAALNGDGCNFAVFSKNARRVFLLLYNSKDANPEYIIPLNSKINKTGDIWHIYVYGVKSGQCYGYAFDGKYKPDKTGHRYNVHKLIVDPYSKALCGQSHWDERSFGFDLNSNKGYHSFSKVNNYDSGVKSIVVGNTKFDWNNDKPLNIPFSKTIIYEMHVRGFTIDKSSKVKYPGTYLGIIDKIPYLKELGVTAVELLPVFEFNELEDIRFNPITKERLKNFWGYSTLSFFAPESWYSSTFSGLDAVIEFKKMIKALHKAGIEVILDVVYNHTGEGGLYGPTVCYSGIDNAVYYLLDKDKRYLNYSGCGNTFNCNNPIVKKLIMDSLKYWVSEMHVDGFRFDLAAILGRNESGEWSPEHSILSEITKDPVLSNTKIIGECWDAAGLYKVGEFPKGWAEWNDKYRDDVRSFIKGDNNVIKGFIKRLTGSPDIFYREGKKPYHSINFVTCHDGFTLNDLVSYNHKHNEGNGENNRDGADHNLSYNYGVEGSVDDPEITTLRERQIKNFITILFISQGTPMILSGDEIKFTKKGNNNTYCQDNELNWFNWNLLKENKEIFEFTKFMINFRRNHPVLRRERFLIEKSGLASESYDLIWHGVELEKPDLSSHSHSIALQLKGDNPKFPHEEKDDDIYIAVNAFWNDLIFDIPEPHENKKWHRVVDTNDKKMPEGDKMTDVITESKLHVKSRSIIILIEK